MFKQQTDERCIMERTLREIRRQVSLFMYLFSWLDSCSGTRHPCCWGFEITLCDTHTYTHTHTHTHTHTNIHIHTLSVGIPLTRNRPVAETFTRDDTTLTRDGQPCSWRDSNCNPSKTAAADPRLIPQGHGDRLVFVLACRNIASVPFQFTLW